MSKKVTSVSISFDNWHFVKRVNLKLSRFVDAALDAERKREVERHE